MSLAGYVAETCPIKFKLPSFVWVLTWKKNSGRKITFFQKKEKNPLNKMVQKLWKLDKKYGRYDILKFPLFFGKHFLTSPYEYSIGWNDDVMPSQLSSHFIYIQIFLHKMLEANLYTNTKSIYHYECPEKKFSSHIVSKAKDRP